MAEGQIVKALSGYYYVQDKETNKIWQCRARGVFKNRNITPLVGDYVVYESSTDSEGTVIEVLERKNELIRPPIANVDQVLLVFSVEEPAFNALLLDKFLVHIEAAGIQPIICLSKADLLDSVEEKYPEIRVYSQIGYTVLNTSTLFKTGLEELKQILMSRTTVLAGQSGVGKSSLLNALHPSLNLETQAISSRLGRGRHTTRHVELIPLPFGGVVADTPGFSQLDFLHIEPEELGRLFIEFKFYESDCKFRGCLHLNEPDCAVKQAVQESKLAPHRYQHYLQFLTEIREEQQRKRY